jgi:hypothetical protein
MSKEEFQERIRSTSPTDLASEYFHSDSTYLFADPASYRVYRDLVASFVSPAEAVAIVGSGNWRYSLNPDKEFREFGGHSDVDVAVISETHFQNLWEEMRTNHRMYFYRLDPNRRTRLRRNGENVYAGFISPAWIPNRAPHRTLAYKKLLNRLSDRSVRFLSVKMFFFKNIDEALDYYTRGFTMARKALR